MIVALLKSLSIFGSIFQMYPCSLAVLGLLGSKLPCSDLPVVRTERRSEKQHEPNDLVQVFTGAPTGIHLFWDLGFRM